MAAAKSVSRNELKFGWVGKRVTMYPNMWKMKYENFDLRGLSLSFEQKENKKEHETVPASLGDVNHSRER